MSKTSLTVAAVLFSQAHQQFRGSKVGFGNQPVFHQGPAISEWIGELGVTIGIDAGVPPHHIDEAGFARDPSGSR